MNFWRTSMAKKSAAITREVASVEQAIILQVVVEAV